MKKIVSALLACVMLVSSLFVLTSCFGGGGIPNGTYEADGQEVVVKGSELSMEQLGIKVVYTYELNDDKTEITLTFKDVKAASDASDEIKDAIDEVKDMYKEMEPQKSEFELTDDGFKVEGLEFKKK